VKSHSRFEIHRKVLHGNFHSQDSALGASIHITTALGFRGLFALAVGTTPRVISESLCYRRQSILQYVQEHVAFFN
jgi:hypothetical protein